MGCEYELSFFLSKSLTWINDIGMFYFFLKILLKVKVYPEIDIFTSSFYAFQNKFFICVSKYWNAEHLLSYFSAKIQLFKSHFMNFIDTFTKR